jgi:hypothetical protein
MGIDSMRSTKFAGLVTFVMAGLVPAIHAFNLLASKTWMPGARPGMTNGLDGRA